MQNMCAEIKIRAERRAGEIIKENKKNPGGQAEHKSYRFHDGTGRPAIIEELGINRMQSHYWQKIATIPEERFEQHIEQVKLAKEELTTAGVLKIAQICYKTALF